MPNQRILLRNLSNEEKLKHLNLGLRLQGIDADEIVLKRIIQTYELILYKGGNLNLEDIVKIETENPFPDP